MDLLESLRKKLDALFTPLEELRPTKEEYFETCKKCGKKIPLGRLVKNPGGSWSVGEYYQIPKDCTQSPDGSHDIWGL